MPYMWKSLSHNQLCNSMDYIPPRLLCPWGFSRQEYWSGLPCLPPGDLPNPGTKPRSPTLQAYPLLTEPPGKPKNTVGNLSLLQGIFLTHKLNWGLLHCRYILYQQSYQGSPNALHAWPQSHFLLTPSLFHQGETEDWRAYRTWPSPLIN